MREALVKIKTAAEILGRSINTLRKWDRSGFLRASRGKNGYRLYSINKLEKLVFLKKIKRKRSPRGILRGD